MTKPLVLAALGNTVMSDDGLGPRVLEFLKTKTWPRPVRFLCAGTSSLSLVELLKSDSRMILIDAVYGGYKPGTVYRLRADRLFLSQDVYSLHDLHLLHLASRFYPARLKELTILAMEPACLRPGLSLSAAVGTALPLLVRLATLEIIKASIT